jgi:hypothetical protein
MEFVLVLQFPEDSEEFVKTLEELEDLLIEELGEVGEIDGHEVGDRQTNLLILTDHPKKAFKSVKKVLSAHGLLDTMLAAYRETDGEDYTVIWPENFDGIFEIL